MTTPTAPAEERLAALLHEALPEHLWLDEPTVRAARRKTLARTLAHRLLASGVTLDADEAPEEITARKFTFWFLMQDRGKQADWMRSIAPSLSDLTGWEPDDSASKGAAACEGGTDAAE